MRTRSRSIAVDRGFVYRTQTLRDKVTVVSDALGNGDPGSIESMDDVDDGNWVHPNYAAKTEIVREGGRFSGYYYNKGGFLINEWVASNYRMTGVGRAIPAMPTSTIPPLPLLATEALSQTRPGKPHVSLPVAIGELRDLPKTLNSYMNSRDFRDMASRMAGTGRYKKPSGLAPQRVSSYNRKIKGTYGSSSNRSSNNSIAEFQFGILPLIRDIVNLFSIPKFVDDRIDRIRRNAGVIREHRSVHKYTTPDVGPIQTGVPFNTAHGISVTSSVYRKFTEEARATVVWRPRSSTYGTSDQSMREYAMSMALGMTPAHVVHGLWELLPWSWLIDWFGNTGQYLSLMDSILSYSSTVTISVKRDITDTYIHTSVSSWGHASECRLSRRSWVRTPVVPPLWAPIYPSPPMLSGNQLLLLLGIADNNRIRMR